jgi:hypothetical protein
MNNFSRNVAVPATVNNPFGSAAIPGGAKRHRGISLRLDHGRARYAITVFSIWMVFLAALAVFAGVANAQEKKTASGEEFFMIASIDQAKSQVLLKRPTEVTLLAKVTNKTQLLDEKGKPVKLSDLRAGDTVWAVTSGGDQNTSIERLRKGPMTVSELHQYYLDYPEIK